MSGFEYLIEFVIKFKNMLFRYSLLKLIVGTSSKSIVILIFEFIIKEFIDKYENYSNVIEFARK